MIVWPPCSIRTETRRRLSRGSSEMHVSQSHAIEGTPVEVPVPKKVSRISLESEVWGSAWALTSAFALQTPDYFPPVISLALTRDGWGDGGLCTESNGVRK